MNAVGTTARSCCTCPHHLPFFSIAPKLPNAAKVLRFDPLRLSKRHVVVRNSTNGDELSSPSADVRAANSAEFCIIESREGVKDFELLELAEIDDKLIARKNRIFLLMEEIRRLRIQQRIKGGEVSPSQELAKEQWLSALPFLPPISEGTMNSYYLFYVTFVTAVIAFGGLLAPMLEFKLGIGGTSYADFIESVHLPSNLAEVDPIIASFCGGAVGVLSALLVVEVNNLTRQRHNRCQYCQGTGYLMCGNCAGDGTTPLNTLVLATAGASSLNGSSASTPNASCCSVCSGMGKVMCTGCLCTGKTMATEHDPRIDPFT